MIDYERYINNAEKVKHILLYQLYVDDIITDNEYKEYSEKWGFILMKKTWYRSFFERFWPGKYQTDDTMVYKFVKLNTYELDELPDITDDNISTYTIEELEAMLKDAILNENYNVAGKIRDELNKRDKDKS